MLKVEFAGWCGRVATRSDQNVFVAEKTYVLSISKSNLDKVMVTTKRE